MLQNTPVLCASIITLPFLIVTHSLWIEITPLFHWLLYTSDIRKASYSFPQWSCSKSYILNSLNLILWEDARETRRKVKTASAPLNKNIRGGGAPQPLRTALLAPALLHDSLSWTWSRGLLNLHRTWLLLNWRDFRDNMICVGGDWLGGDGK